MRQSIYCLIDNYATLFFVKSSPHLAHSQLPKAYCRLRARLAQTGWVALGSLLERKLPGQGGPRYQWSRRVKGKTVTVALSREQFVWLKRALANQRKVNELLSKMNRLTLAYMWKNLPNTTRRKRLSNKTLGLN
jgi:hypothetical protein